MTWPDLVIGFIALLFALKGWKRGFVAEIGGFIALAAAICAAIYYPGTFDTFFGDDVHLGFGSAHVVGMVVFALIVYVALMVISSVLSRIAKLPVISLGNGLGGALVGVAKSLVGVWVVLYVLLFFPLTRDIRTDFHNSTLVAFVTQENPQIDVFLRGTMPWFVRPLVAPLFARHRV
ncbi:MAG: CvpA family protein [Candidatus Eremiobacteraeota bacterium]|nr:CvpA family protein [Candidatus Eremiobacteraeota bacterium]